MYNAIALSVQAICILLSYILFSLCKLCTCTLALALISCFYALKMHNILIKFAISLLIIIMMCKNSQNELTNSTISTLHYQRIIVMNTKSNHKSGVL